jgi:Flp pilus assembly protein TadD
MSDRTASRPASLVPEHVLQQAVALQNQGNLPAAEKIYRAILKQHPHHFETLRKLASGLFGADRFEEAERVLRKALFQRPNLTETQAMLARALHRLGRDDEALELISRSIASDPGFADAHAVLGSILALLGRYDEARGALARAIELAPDRPLYYYQWGNIARWHVDDQRLATLEALGSKAGTQPPDEQIYLNFALAKAYADCGDNERAFRHCLGGAALRRKSLNYGEASTLRQMEILIQMLDAEWVLRHASVGDPSTQPLFIVGMPRSGTTLVDQVLVSHPGIRSLGESALFETAFTQKNRSLTGVPTPIGHMAVQMSDTELRKLGTRYLEAARQNAPAVAARIINKLPHNFRLVGLIHAALPNARIIHVRRDPVDTCLSIFSTLFAGNSQPYSYDLGELGRYYRAYEKMMDHWRNVLPAGVMLDVQYEAVVDDLEREARRIVAYCGLDWDDACLTFYKSDRPIRTASHAQVRQPIYRSSVGRPRPPRELLSPLLEALGAD